MTTSGTDRTELPLSEAPRCECAGDDATIPELDARQIPHAIRHASIFGAFSAIAPGGAMVFVAPHDPLPFLAQLADREGDAVEVSYVQRGPDAWKLKLARRA